MKMVKEEKVEIKEKKEKKKWWPVRILKKLKKAK